MNTFSLLQQYRYWLLTLLVAACLSGGIYLTHQGSLAVSNTIDHTMNSGEFMVGPVDGHGTG